MIDRSKCMASCDGSLGGPRCQDAATHESVWGRRCTKHADELKKRLRDPSTLGNIIAGRARTEEEIGKMVRELPS